MQKWVGESEKLVRTLFAVARAKQPSIVFIDEVDSLLTSRGEGEQESSRRVKTEFLIQLDGAGTKASDFILIIGATNRPQELDEAARRRFTRRIYVPLPDAPTRADMLNKLLAKEPVPPALTDEQRAAIVAATAGYSGADMKQLCKEAAFHPLRRKMEWMTQRGVMERFDKADCEPISIIDFNKALAVIKPSVAPSEIKHYVEWNEKFGSEAGSKTQINADGSTPEGSSSGGGAGARAAAPA